MTPEKAAYLIQELTTDKMLLEQRLALEKDQAERAEKLWRAAEGVTRRRRRRRHEHVQNQRV